MTTNELPPPPPLDKTRMLGYDAIRYVAGYPESYVHEYARAYAEAALAARPAAAPIPATPEGWQPIETAPKDGTEVLLWREDCGQFIGLFTSPDSFPLPQAEIDAADEETLFQRDWFTQWPDARRLEGSETPTHWQPLPLPPGAASTTSEAKPVVRNFRMTDSDGEAKEAGPRDEQDEFERHLRALSPHHDLSRHVADKTWWGGEASMPTYRDKHTEALWEGWRARASLSTSQAPVSELTETIRAQQDSPETDGLVTITMRASERRTLSPEALKAFDDMVQRATPKIREAMKRRAQGREDFRNTPLSATPEQSPAAPTGQEGRKP